MLQEFATRFFYALTIERKTKTERGSKQFVLTCLTASEIVLNFSYFSVCSKLLKNVLKKPSDCFFHNLAKKKLYGRGLGLSTTRARLTAFSGYFPRAFSGFDLQKFVKNMVAF